MSGVITLYNRARDYVKEQKFDGPMSLEKVIDTWQKLYGKAFAKCSTDIKYDGSKRKPKDTKESKSPVKEPVRLEKSPFKKGKLSKTYKVRKPNRMNLDWH